MTPLVGSSSPEAPTTLDLVSAIQQVLRASPEPLTVSRIRAGLPSAHRSIDLEELAEVLRRQVASNVLMQYPRYRSQQDRFWDRPMEVHVVALLQTALSEGALPWSELRRKLPAYAQGHAENVLHEHVNRGTFHRHPRTGRGGERFGTEPPHPRDYLRNELRQVFEKLERLGFQQAQVREAAIELLHEEEWSSPPRREEQTQATEQADREPAGQPQSSERSEQERHPESTSSAAAHATSESIGQARAAEQTQANRAEAQPTQPSASEAQPNQNQATPQP